MIKISPSILSADFSCLDKELRAIEAAGCDYIHIDVMDGHFVPNLTVGPKVIHSIKKCSDKPFDVHLMIENVEHYAKYFAEAGADIITFHYEATKDVKSLISIIKKLGKKVGISIKPKTLAEEILPYLNQLDLILVMTVEPGFGGQDFMSDQLDKIKIIADYIKQHKLHTELEVDGGINDKTAKLVIDAGAKVLVAGSYIFVAGEKEYKTRIDSLRK